jgi:hypothetical protein
MGGPEWRNLMERVGMRVGLDAGHAPGKDLRGLLARWRGKQGALALQSEGCLQVPAPGSRNPRQLESTEQRGWSQSTSGRGLRELSGNLKAIHTG